MNSLPDCLIAYIETFINCHEIPYEKSSKTANQLATNFRHELMTFDSVTACRCEFADVFSVIKQRKSPVSSMKFKTMGNLAISLMLSPDIFGNCYICCDGTGVSYNQDKTTGKVKLCDHGHPLKKKKNKSI